MTTVKISPKDSIALAVLQELGADHLINYKQEDFAQVVKEHTTAKKLPVRLLPLCAALRHYLCVLSQQ